MTADDDLREAIGTLHRVVTEQVPPGPRLLGSSRPRGTDARVPLIVSAAVLLLLGGTVWLPDLFRTPELLGAPEPTGQRPAATAPVGTAAPSSPGGSAGTPAPTVTSAPTGSRTSGPVPPRGSSAEPAPRTVTVTRTAAARGPAPVPPAPPSGAVSCAKDGEVCEVPDGRSAVVWYGADVRWARAAGVVGSFRCDESAFGNPARSADKTCRYALTGRARSAPPVYAARCGQEGAACLLPVGRQVTVWMGSGDRWVGRTGLSGSVRCTIQVFGDTLTGGKTCRYLVVGASVPPSAPPDRSSVVTCAVEGGECLLPLGTLATVWFGDGRSWVAVTGQTGTVRCDIDTFNVNPDDEASCLYRLEN